MRLISEETIEALYNYHVANNTPTVGKNLIKLGFDPKVLKDANTLYNALPKAINMSAYKGQLTSAKHLLNNKDDEIKQLTEVNTAIRKELDNAVIEINKAKDQVGEAQGKLRVATEQVHMHRNAIIEEKRKGIEINLDKDKVMAELNKYKVTLRILCQEYKQGL